MSTFEKIYVHSHQENSWKWHFEFLLWIVQSQCIAIKISVWWWIFQYHTILKPATFWVIPFKVQVKTSNNLTSILTCPNMLWKVFSKNNSAQIEVLSVHSSLLERSFHNKLIKIICIKLSTRNRNLIDTGWSKETVTFDFCWTDLKITA